MKFSRETYHSCHCLAKERARVGGKETHMPTEYEVRVRGGQITGNNSVVLTHGQLLKGSERSSKVKSPFIVILTFSPQGARYVFHNRISTITNCSRALHVEVLKMSDPFFR